VHCDISAVVDQHSVRSYIHPFPEDAMLIPTFAQQKAERLLRSQLRYDDRWASPERVDSILMALPYRVERTIVVAALREFRGRVSYAIDYLMPGKGMADLSDSDPGYGYDDYRDDPPTPGKGFGFDLGEDDPPTPPWKGIDFDLSEEELAFSGDGLDARAGEGMCACVRELEKRVDGLQEEVAMLKTQLDKALR